MHPLLDRHDVTAARQEQAAGAGENSLAAVAAELAANAHLLSRFIREFNASTIELCVTDREPAQFRMKNWPVPGAERLIVRRTGEGGTFTIPQNTPTLVAAANENRLGGSIINSGGQAATLFLTTDLLNLGGLPLNLGTPQIFLPANAIVSWDFRLGNILWCGALNAVCTNAAGTTLVVAEV